MSFNPSYLYAYIKKECNVLPFLCSFITNSIIDLDRNGCMYLFNASRTHLAFLSCSANFRISTHICMADVTLSWADVFVSLSFGLITRCPVVSVGGYFQRSCNCLYSFFLYELGYISCTLQFVQGLVIIMIWGSLGDSEKVLSEIWCRFRFTKSHDLKMSHSKSISLSVENMTS